MSDNAFVLGMTAVICTALVALVAVAAWSQVRQAQAKAGPEGGRDVLAEA
ncbi:hypothetical protein [Streptacidiphilus cavernicola]|uniref:Uncharacterized protein n=1 Tax=Streptacidiphilus cavernicola TaxID=3342716 RepID=A0ABV6VYC8_9ACTN